MDEHNDQHDQGRAKDVGLVIITLTFVKVPVSSVMDERNDRGHAKDISYVPRTSQ